MGWKNFPVKCNTLLGMADDSIDMLQMAINYLKNKEL